MEACQVSRELLKDHTRAYDDVDGTKIRFQQRPSIGGQGGRFNSNRNSGGFFIHGKHNGPIRERRPGGLSYETADGRDPERRGKALLRRQLRYAKRLGKSITKFSKKLLRELLADGTTNDFVISPLSIHMALSMISVGARGSTQKELNKALGFRGLSRFGKGNVHLAYFTLRSILFQTRQDINVIDALGVFVKSRIPLEMNFRQALSQFYNGHFGTLSPTPVEDINRWASNHTEGEMSALLARRSVKPSAKMALTSAMCVKGYWNKPFNTVSGTFFTGSGTESTMAMMEQTMLIRKKAIPDQNLVQLQVVLSREKEKNALVLEMVLMNCTESTQDAIDILTSKSHQQSLQTIAPQRARLVFPKFWLQNGVDGMDFKGALTRLRLRKVFRKKANFMGISSTAGLYLPKMFHQSAVQFNEYGIGCIKPTPHVTSSGNRGQVHHVELQKSSPSIQSDPVPTSTSQSGDSLPTVNVDRMFVFAIREMRFGTYLTAGIFKGPKDTRNSATKVLDTRTSRLKYNCSREEH